MRRPVLVVLIGLVAALAVAGCGRPQAKVETLPTGPLTKDEYIHAFEISANGLAQRYGVGEELTQSASAAEQDRRLAAVQRLLRAWADRLAGLQPPPEAARAQARFVAGVRGFAGDLDRARALLARGDTKAANGLFETGRILSARTRADLVAARSAFHDMDYDIQNLDKAPVETPNS
jgi:hypothetical protein